MSTVRFCAVRLDRPEVHRRAQVEQEPRGELAVLGVLANVRRVHPRGDVPVDVADVVAGLVLAQVGEVEAVAAEQRAVVALEQAVQPADDLPVEALEDAFRRWTRTSACVLAAGRRARGCGQDRAQQVVGGDVVGQRLERQHQAVAHDVERHVEHVLRQDVVAAAHEGQGPRGQDQVDRGARAGAEGEVALEVGQPEALRVAGRRREADRVLDERRVDVDRVGRLLELDAARRSSRTCRPARARRSCARRSTNSSVGAG